MTIDSFQIFKQEVGKYRLLDKVEQLELVKKAKKGDKVAKEKLIKHNLRLIFPIARNFYNKDDNVSFELVDLIQEGVFGLEKAIERFDVDSGNKFSTYAHWWVLQAISETIRNGRIVRVPAYTSRYLPKILEAEEELLKKGINPTEEKISEFTKIPRKQVENIFKSKITYSLDFQVGESTVMGELIEQEIFKVPEEVEKEIFAEERKEAVMDALNTLGSQSKEVLVLRYGLDGFETKRTLKEVADIMGITKERVRQIEQKSFELLRQGSGRSKKRKKLKYFYEEQA